jgi:CubicO group peptidase (beta-lactamase class C family)
MTDDTIKTRALDRVLDSAVGWKLTPSIAMTVVKNGKIVYADVRGSADLERKQAATVETRYPIGSVGTLFVMVGIMQLSAQRRLNLNDSVQRYLPEEIPLDVTLRQLLASQKDDDNYDVLATVIERVSGEPLITYLTDRIFRPAGMTHTWLGEPPPWLPLATGYYEWKDVFGTAKPESDAWDRKCCGFVSTATDLARFDAALMSGTLLSATSLRDATVLSIDAKGRYVVDRPARNAGRLRCREYISAPAALRHRYLNELCGISGSGRHRSGAWTLLPAARNGVWRF